MGINSWRYVDYQIGGDEYIVQAIISAEEQVLRKVLNELLKREPTIEDAKRCSKIIGPGNDGSHYILSYDGICLGEIRKIWKECICSIEFTPIKTYDHGIVPLSKNSSPY